jgi:hypothetical protein
MVARPALTQATVALDRGRTGLAGHADTAVSVRHWPARRRLDVISNPLAYRQMPAAWWSYPALTVTALLGGMLAATYVRSRADRDVTGRSARGGLLSLLAIGCPVVTTGALAGGPRFSRLGDRVNGAAGLGICGPDSAASSPARCRHRTRQCRRRRPAAMVAW